MTTTIRSELRTLERGIRQKWDIPDEVLRMVPMRMLGIMAKGKDRDSIAAARVMAALKSANDMIENPVALVAHQHQHTHEITSPMTVENLEQQRTRLLAECDQIRIHAGGNAGGGGTAK